MPKRIDAGPASPRQVIAAWARPKSRVSFGDSAPTMNGSAPRQHDANSDGVGMTAPPRSFDLARLLQDFRTQQDGASARALERKAGGTEPSRGVPGSVSCQAEQRSIGGFDSPVEDQREPSYAGNGFGGHDVEILIVRVLALKDAAHVPYLGARDEAH